MIGFLRIEKVSSSAIFELLKESSLLIDSNEKELMQILLCLYIRRAAYLNYESANTFVYPKSPYLEDAKYLLEHWTDREWLTIELGRRVQAFAKFLAEELPDLESAFNITDTTISIVIRNTNCSSVSNCISIEAPYDEGASERCNLEYSIENCLDGEIQTFGPMLSGYVFGRVHDGASRLFLCGKRPVTLQFSDEQPAASEFAIDALRRAIVRAEGISPQRIFF